jgi:hypothetical protein
MFVSFLCEGRGGGGNWFIDRVATVDSFCIKFQKFMIEENLKTDKIYNMGECGYIGKVYTQALSLERRVDLGISQKAAKQVAILSIVTVRNRHIFIKTF